VEEVVSHMLKELNMKSTTLMDEVNEMLMCFKVGIIIAEYVMLLDVIFA